jgi:hypothetical protein
MNVGYRHIAINNTRPGFAESHTAKDTRIGLSPVLPRMRISFLVMSYLGQSGGPDANPDRAGFAPRDRRD